MCMEDLRLAMKRVQDASRYEHTLGVAYTAACLAGVYGIDTRKAIRAGLLHDCAKCMDFELSKQLAKTYTPDLDETEKDNKKTIHAPVSAYLAKEKYGVTDVEILSAIRLHTIGKCNMSKFEMIIFIADKIEHKTREIEFREQIEKLSISSVIF